MFGKYLGGEKYTHCQTIIGVKSAGTGFLIDPYVRFEGEPGEQGTFFVKDPSGNALEFKAFRDEGQIFARD